MIDNPNRSGEDRPQGASASRTASAPQTESRAGGLGDLQQKASQDLKEIREVAETEALRALDRSTEMADEKKNLVAEQLAGVAEALTKVGGEMKEGKTAMVGRYASDLGGSARRLAQNLKNRDMGEIVSMAQDFGRRQPVAFLGLAAIAGLAASRFVLASGSRHRADSRMSEGPMNEGRATSANPMAGRETVREVTPSAGASPQAGQSWTGQSATASPRSGQMGTQPLGSQGSQASASSARDRSASGADTPSQSPSGRVRIGETSIGQSPASPAQPNGPSSTRPSNTNSEGRSNV